MSVELPPTLQAREPKEAVETVPVEMAAKRTYSPENVDRLQKHLGLVAINGTRMKSLQELGVEFRALGIMDYFKAGVLITHESLLQAINYLSKIVEDEKAKPAARKEASKNLAYISEKLIKLQLGAVKVEQTATDVVVSADKVRRQSFQPGMKVTSGKST
jgi:hypothetical protein